MGLFIEPKIVPYVPKEDREKPPEAQVVFDLKVLSAREFAAVQDQALDEYGLGMRRGSYVFGLLKYGVRGARGPGVPPFEVDPKTGLVADSFLDRLTGGLRIEISNFLDDLNVLGDDEGKASGS